MCPTPCWMTLPDPIAVYACAILVTRDLAKNAAGLPRFNAAADRSFFEGVLVDLFEVEGLPYLDADVVPDHQLGQLFTVDEP